MSTHPLAQGIVNSLNREEKPDLFDDVENEKGLGIKARTKDGREIKIGSARYVAYEGDVRDRAVFLAVDGKLAAKIIVEDEIKKGAKETIAYLKGEFKEIGVVSGDSVFAVKDLADKLDIDIYHAEVMPKDKLEIMKAYQDAGHKVVFIGDGINDAPVLKNSDIGISMGETASDLAIESSLSLIHI